MGRKHGGKGEIARILGFTGFLNSKYQPITTQCRILTHLRYTTVEDIVRKGEIACYKQFLLFSQCFLTYMVLIFHFKCS